MSEATPASIALAAQYAGTTEPSDTEPIVDEAEDQVEELEDTETEETEEKDEEELPDTVKEILKKNRKAVREAEARAVAAEKALKAKDAPTSEPSEADSKFKELYVKSAAKTALVEAGITTSTDRFLKMLDLSSVEVDESGAVSGLEDQIAGLKEDFADILAPKPVRKSVGNTDGARKAAPSVPKSSAERMAAMLGG